MRVNFFVALIVQSVWSTPPYNEKKLNKAFKVSFVVTVSYELCVGGVGMGVCRCVCVCVCVCGWVWVWMCEYMDVYVE